MGGLATMQAGTKVNAEQASYVDAPRLASLTSGRGGW